MILEYRRIKSENQEKSQHYEYAIQMTTISSSALAQPHKSKHCPSPKYSTEPNQARQASQTIGLAAPLPSEAPEDTPSEETAEADKVVV
jgi:hypothetical protein